MNFPSGEAVSFTIDLDDSGYWRVYHEPCGTDIYTAKVAVNLEHVLNHVTTHKCPTVDPKTALDYAIFAVNNHTDPDASTEEDVARLEKDAAGVISALSRLREYVIASGEDLPDWVEGEGGDVGAVGQVPVKRGRPEERPLSDFAIHIGLVPYEQAFGPDGRAAGIWVDGDTTLRFGKDHVDHAVRELPGLYIDGTWTEWGGVSEDDPTTHLVYRFGDGLGWTDFGAVIGGLWTYIKRHQGWGGLTDTWTISMADDYAEQVATVTVTDGDAIAVPRDWRTR